MQDASHRFAPRHVLSAKQSSAIYLAGLVQHSQCQPFIQRQPTLNACSPHSRKRLHCSSTTTSKPRQLSSRQVEYACPALALWQCLDGIAIGYKNNFDCLHLHFCVLFSATNSMVFLLSNFSFSDTRGVNGKLSTPLNWFVCTTTK